MRLVIINADTGGIDIIHNIPPQDQIDYIEYLYEHAGYENNYAAWTVIEDDDSNIRHFQFDTPMTLPIEIPKHGSKNKETT